MDSNLNDQIFNLIDKSQNILLLTHAKADCDGLGSMISMYIALQNLGKNVVAATNDPAPENLSFLPSLNIVQNSITSKDFVITVDLSHTPLHKIKYKLTDDKKSVNIVVTPSEGRFSAEDVSFGQEAGNFDLIMTFDTGNLEHLGPIYDQNTELFFKVPVLNIDHHASNTDYGQVNLVDVVAASTTEVVLGLLEEMNKKYQKQFINEDVATLLLAGLITDTGSFQHANTSPKAMETAAKLLDLGARQQEIIKSLYKTKKLSTLKLWGVVLSKVETDPIYRLVWSSISKKDLEETGASSEESETIIDDLLSNAPGTEMIMLFKHNDEGYVSVSMRSTTNSVDVGKFCQEMGGGGHVRAAGFKKRDGSTLEQLIQETLAKAREYQGARLNIHPKGDNAEMQHVASHETPEKEIPDVMPPASEKEEKKNQYLDFKDERNDQQATPTVEQLTQGIPNLSVETKKPEAAEAPLITPKAETPEVETQEIQPAANQAEPQILEIQERSQPDMSMEEDDHEGIEAPEVMMQEPEMPSSEPESFVDEEKYENDAQSAVKKKRRRRRRKLKPTAEEGIGAIKAQGLASPSEQTTAAQQPQPQENQAAPQVSQNQPGEIPPAPQN